MSPAHGTLTSLILTNDRLKSEVHYLRMELVKLCNEAGWPERATKYRKAIVE